MGIYYIILNHKMNNDNKYDNNDDGKESPNNDDNDNIDNKSKLYKMKLRNKRKNIDKITDKKQKIINSSNELLDLSDMDNKDMDNQDMDKDIDERGNVKDLIDYSQEDAFSCSEYYKELSEDD